MNDSDAITAKLPISQSTRRRNAGIFGRTDAHIVTHEQDGVLKALDEHGRDTKSVKRAFYDGPKQEIPSAPKPLLNRTETRFRDLLISRGFTNIMEQAITLRLDPPFKSYRPDLAVVESFNVHVTNMVGLTFYEVKGPHRFREKGIAKAALAAKIYPQFTFILCDWDGSKFIETRL